LGLPKENPGQMGFGETGHSAEYAHVVGVSAVNRLYLLLLTGESAWKTGFFDTVSRLKRGGDRSI